MVPILPLTDVTEPCWALMELLISPEGDNVESYSESWANPSWVLGRILRIVASRKALATRPIAEVRRVAQQLILRWSWSEYIMSGLVQVVDAL